MKLIVSIAVFVINIAMGVAVFLVSLIAMNGYSESDASVGLIAFAGVSLTAALICGIGAAVSAKALLKKGYRPVSAAPASVVAFTVLGAFLQLAASVVGVFTAEITRVYF